jgi:hypothetical protein
VERKKLTLRPPPAKLQRHTPPPADPVKIGLSDTLGWRFISRKGRYILQARMVRYEQGYGPSPDGTHTIPTTVIADTTWVDVPLVPEAYG